MRAVLVPERALDQHQHGLPALRILGALELLRLAHRRSGGLSRAAGDAADGQHGEHLHPVAAGSEGAQDLERALEPALRLFRVVEHQEGGELLQHVCFELRWRVRGQPPLRLLEERERTRRRVERPL